VGFEKICRRLLEYGVLAPSTFNNQPWKFSIDEARGILGLYPDPERALSREVDPIRRELYLAVGACLENIVLAAPALGYVTKEVVLPRGEAGPAALLALKPLPEAEPDPLFSSLLLRQTHAGKYQPGSVADIHLERLRHVSPFSSRERIHFLAEEKREKFTALLHDLAHEMVQDPAWVEETVRWMDPDNGVEGLLLSSIGLPISAKVRHAVLRRFFPMNETVELARQVILRQGHGIEAPGFLLLTTEDASPKGYLNAGRWYSRLALTLSEIELGSQALLTPIARWGKHPELRDYFGSGEREEPVLCLRFGHPLSKRWPRTGRRPLSESLISDGKSGS
jgi:hypothetical protein